MDPLYGGAKSSRSLMDPYNGFIGTDGSNQSRPLDSSNPWYSTDMFASVGFNAQFGQFERRFLDFTKLGVRLDVGAASALMSAISSESRESSSQELPTCERGRPTLAVCLQQQVRKMFMETGIIQTNMHDCRAVLAD